MKKYFKESGDDSERFAIQLADEARDRIDEINAEITALTDKNKVLENGRGSASSIAFDRNSEQLEKLSEDLGLFKAQLKASEEQISITDDSQKDKNKTDAEANEIAQKTIASLREKIKAERENIENIDIETESGRSIIRSKGKLIEGYQAEIDAILGTTRARKGADKAIKGSIGYYEKLISTLKTQQKNTSTNGKEWETYQKIIEGVEDQLLDLEIAINGV
jgi:chromosome segregation ATPase